MNFKPSSPKLDDATPSQMPAENDATKNRAPRNSKQDTDTPSSSMDLSIDAAMRRDRFRLRRQRKQLTPAEFETRLKKSVALHQSRLNASVRLEYPPELPISSHRDELVQLIRDHQVVIVCGETGSGKSTQLPKFCLEAGLGRSAMIGHTQPRRLAARSIGARLAEELDTPLGISVGYQVRFGDKTGPETLVKLMTDGILLAETQSDRFLDSYDAIIIDEAHERSLNIDFQLGYLRQLTEKRNDLKLIITSATIDAERFSNHFTDPDGKPAPIVNVSGRGYPVEIRYLPWEEVVDDETRGYDLSHHIIEGIKNLSRSGTGDTLVFLPTERDIREVSHRVAGHFKRLGLLQRIDILPLYARLPQKEQQRIFHPTGGRQRFIFATNVAESSLTVPGIHYVIDAGTARISRYSPRSKLQRLPIEPVSQASANQRAGRCGRIAPGICIRLYDVADFESRDEFTTPEIRRTNLASVVLQTKVLKIGPLDQFPLLDPPRPESIREGIQTLTELGALDESQSLTPIGIQLGRMPVDPRIGRILLAADEFGVLPEVLPIAAALENPDPRVRPPEKQQAADQAHAEFVDPKSDFLSLLRLWRFYEDSRAEYSRNRLRLMLQKRFLSPTRMREWSDVYRQLKETVAEIDRHGKKQRGKKQSPARRKRKIGEPRLNDDPQKPLLEKDRYAAVHQALLTGLLSGIAMVGDKNEYQGPRGVKLFLWPGSGVFDAKPKWIVAAELVETAKQYARTVAQIQPQWIESVAGHLLKATYSDPHWSKKGSGAFCYQRLSLFGLPVVARRRVPLAPIDPATARELLIQHGLVQRELQTRAQFVSHNRRLRDSIETLAAKTRRRDLVVDDYRVQQFYIDRLPSDACDRFRLEKADRNEPAPVWSKKLSGSADLSSWLESPPEDLSLEKQTRATENSQTLYMRPEDLLDVGAAAVSEEDFPEALEVGNSRLPLEYRFEPGSENDGVQLTVHQSALDQISDDRLGWLVPGLMKPKLIALIKSLPKRIRRNLVPAADVADAIHAELSPLHGQVPFLGAVCEAFSRHAEMTVHPEDFQTEKLENHLEFLVDVVDDSGNSIAKGRSVKQLSAKIGGKLSADENSPADFANTHDLPTDPMKSFDVETLPDEIVTNRGGVSVAQFVGLIDKGDAAQAKLFSNRESAEAAHAQGITRLYAIAERKELRRQVRWMPALDEAKIQLSGAISSATFEQSLMDLLARIAFVDGAAPIRTREEFESRRKDGSRRIPIAVQAVTGWLAQMGEHYLKVRGAIESTPQARYAEAQADVSEQIQWLMHDTFLSAMPWQWLKHYPRYLSAIVHRLEKLRSGAADRDASGTEIVRDLMHRWQESLPENDRTPERTASSQFRWMIEELRVSMFAQQLGTSIKVSPTRCEKLLQ